MSTHRSTKRHRARATVHRADRPTPRRGRRLAVMVVSLVAVAGPAVAYTIRPGDTLSGIAAEHHTTVQCLAQANGISNVDLIFAGAELKIRHCADHAVASSATTTNPSRSGSRGVYPTSPIPAAGAWHAHSGYPNPAWDITIAGQADCGELVRSSRSGTATVYDWDYSYGKHVEVADSLYAHLSELLVQSGDVVQVGDVIGRVGETGNAYGCHLHYEIGR